jgi:hypothetical protein
MMAFCPYDDCEEQIDVDSVLDESVTCPKCGRESEVNVEIHLTPLTPISKEERE